jgi:uncharacterized membrane protein
MSGGGDKWVRVDIRLHNEKTIKIQKMMTENNSKQKVEKQEILKTGTYDYLDEKSSERRFRRALRAATESVSENQWLLPVAGAVLGVLIGLGLGRAGGDPNPDMWSITVDEARSSVLSALSILFAGLSIVLALGSVTIQNVVGRFSLRLLRIYIRNPWDKAVIAVFALTSTFILTEWFLLSALPTEALAPVGGIITGMLLLFFSGAMIIWYISALTSWFRVDRTVRRIGRHTLRAARSRERSRVEDSPASEISFEQPPDAVPILANRSGYITEVDMQGFFDLALRYDTQFVITRCEGWSVVRGEPIGWITTGKISNVDLPQASEIVDMIDITRERELVEDVGYGIVVLVDIAIMALSPGINDPNTAVQVIEELTSLFPLLAQVRLGPTARIDAQGVPRVVQRALTFGEYLEMATAQIVLYSGGDPVVMMALQRFVQVLQRLDLPAGDQQPVETFAGRVRKLTGENSNA